MAQVFNLLLDFLVGPLKVLMDRVALELASFLVSIGALLYIADRKSLAKKVIVSAIAGFIIYTIAPLFLAFGEAWAHAIRDSLPKLRESIMEAVKEAATLKP